MSAPLLEVENLSIEYVTDARTVRAVDRVMFTVDEREVFGLAGESGCGKSTIANAILRLLRDPAIIAGGSIRFRGVDVLSLGTEELRSFRWRQVAMVFQSAMNSLNPVMTIGDQIADIYTTHERVSRREALRRAAGLLDLVGIPHDRLQSYPHQLSGGMRQRVVIAMATALRPPLLIMDEPTTALDVVVQQEIMAQIKDLQQELGFAILFITHDMSLMVELSDRMAVMYAGRFVETASALTIFETPRHPYTSALMNAFPPMTGPRVPLRGLGEGIRFRDIPDLIPVGPDHWVAPTADQAPLTEATR
ncbi:ABC transporter ATP-binding protein [Microbacterium sp. NPDC016588]